VIRALWRDGAVYALGTIVSRGLGVLLLPLYTHALPPDSFGLLDLIVTAGVLINLVVPLETPQSVARLWNEREEGVPRRRLAGTGLCFAVLGYVVFLAVAWAAAASIALWLSGQAHHAPAVRAGAAFIAANGVMLVLQGQFRAALRPRAFAIAGVCYSVMVLGGLAVLVSAKAASAAGVLWVQCASAGAVAIACAWALRRDVTWAVDRGELREMLRFSLPLVPAGVAVFATLNLHRFVLNSMSTLEEVGLFGIASRLAAVATLVLIGVQSALTPLIYAHHGEPETPAQLARLLELFWGLALLASLSIAVFGPELLALLAAPAYGTAAPIVVWLAPAALLAQMYVFAPGIPLAKKTRWQLALTVVSAVSGLVLSLMLVPRWQALGAAAAACAASGLFFGAWLVMGQRLYPLPLRWRRLALATIVYAGLATVAMHLMDRPAGPALWVAKVALVASLLLALGLVGLLRTRSPARARVPSPEED
jgi:O-antigen/teichoic acid export membrane protein